MRSLYLNEKLIFSILFFLLCISCTNSTKEKTSFFDSEIEYIPVKTEKSVTFENIYRPRVMKVIGDKLFISDDSQEPSVHILEINEDHSLSYLKGFGRIGEGPGEFTRLQDIIKTNNIVYMYDGSQLKLVGYNKNGELLPEQQIELKTQGLAESFYQTKKGEFVATGLFFEDRFQVYNQEGELSGKFGNVIPIDEKFSARDNALAWRSFGAVNPEGNRVYLFAANANNIEMYNLEGELLKTIKGKETPVPKMTLNETGWPIDNGGIMAYEGVDVNQEFIYGFYSGAKRSVFKKGKGSLFEQMEFNKIHKLDWELNLVDAYELDHIPTAFAVDHRGGVYSISQTDEGTSIRYTELKSSN